MLPLGGRGEPPGKIGTAVSGFTSHPGGPWEAGQRGQDRGAAPPASVGTGICKPALGSGTEQLPSFPERQKGRKPSRPSEWPRNARWGCDHGEAAGGAESGEGGGWGTTNQARAQDSGCRSLYFQAPTLRRGRGGSASEMHLRHGQRHVASERGVRHPGRHLSGRQEARGFLSPKHAARKIIRQKRPGSPGLDLRLRFPVGAAWGCGFPRSRSDAGGGCAPGRDRK